MLVLASFALTTKSQKIIVISSLKILLILVNFRALMWNLRKEQQKAVEDLNSALKLNQCHVGALILRGNIDQPMQVRIKSVFFF